MEFISAANGNVNVVLSLLQNVHATCTRAYVHRAHRQILRTTATAAQKNKINMADCYCAANSTDRTVFCRVTHTHTFALKKLFARINLSSSWLTD